MQIKVNHDSVVVFNNVNGAKICSIIDPPAANNKFGHLKQPHT